MLATVGVPAQACVAPVPLAVRHVRDADVVVVGWVVSYRIFRDPLEKQRRKKLLDGTSGELRKILEKSAGQGGPARFDIIVDEVLVGRAPKRIRSVIWTNSTFELPKRMPPGPFLIALNYPRSQTHPRPEQRTTLHPDPRSGAMTVLQAACSAPFMFRKTSGEAAAVREILKPGAARSAPARANG